MFGSVVRGSARPGSDLDLQVEFPASPIFEQVIDLKLELEDLVTRRGLLAELRQCIDDEAIPLALAAPIAAFPTVQTSGRQAG